MTYRFRTWHAEHAVVASALLASVILAGDSWVELIGAVAVQASFGHTAVADRLAEREARRSVPEVECHRMALRYFVTKESAWFVYFLVHRSWSALVGVVVFLAYPLWRGWYRRRFPIGRAE